MNASVGLPAYPASFVMCSPLQATPGSPVLQPASSAVNSPMQTISLNLAAVNKLGSVPDDLDGSGAGEFKAEIVATVCDQMKSIVTSFSEDIVKMRADLQ